MRFKQIFVEMLQTDGGAFAGDETVFDNVFKFPDISGERIVHKKAKDFRRDGLEVLALEEIEPVIEVIDKEGNVLFSFFGSSALVPDSSCKGLLGIAEKFRLKKLLGQGRAVDATKGPVFRGLNLWIAR